MITLAMTCVYEGATAGGCLEFLLIKLSFCFFRFDLMEEHPEHEVRAAELRRQLIAMIDHKIEELRFAI